MININILNKDYSYNALLCIVYFHWKGKLLISHDYEECSYRNKYILKYYFDIFNDIKLNKTK
jgi:hypothetical protein